MQTRKLYAYTHFGVVTIFIQLLQVAISDVEQDMVPAGADASELDNFGAGGSIRDCLCSVSVRKYIQNIGRGIYDLWLCTRLHEEAVGR